MNRALDHEDMTTLCVLYDETHGVAEFTAAARQKSPSFAALGENALKTIWMAFDVSIDMHPGTDDW